MNAIGDRLSELAADVVAFQEVWSGAARDLLLRKGEAAGYHAHWFRDDAIGGSGLMMLSRLPILESHFEPFSMSGTFEQLDNGELLSGKGFVKLRLQGAGRVFQVVNTHLHARYTRRAKHQFRSHRVAQIIQLAASVRQVDEPVVIAGDFNFVEDTPEYRVLAGLTGARDAAQEYGDPLPTMLRSNEYRKRIGLIRSQRRVDYLFLRDGSRIGLQPVQVDRVFDEKIELEGRPADYSNHAGVSAELEVLPAEVVARQQLSQRAIELAERLLTKGREETRKRREDRRLLSGVGMACAILAVAGGRSQAANRRRFLQRGLKGAALVALAPGIGASVMSEFVLPTELSAFDQAEEHLEQLVQRAVDTRDELPS